MRSAPLSAVHAIQRWIVHKDCFLSTTVYGIGICLPYQDTEIHAQPPRPKKRDIITDGGGRCQ